MSKGTSIYDYGFLLDRFYRLIPEPATIGGRFETPKPIVIYIGSYTVIRNFREIADRMKREPRLLGRYLLKELAAAGDYDEPTGSFKINVRVSAPSLTQLFERFVRSYVLCPTCGAPDTYIKKVGKAWLLKCEACGAEQPIKPF